MASPTKADLGCSPRIRLTASRYRLLALVAAAAVIASVCVSPASGRKRGFLFGRFSKFSINIRNVDVIDWRNASLPRGSGVYLRTVKGNRCLHAGCCGFAPRQVNATSNCPTPTCRRWNFSPIRRLLRGAMCLYADQARRSAAVMVMHCRLLPTDQRWTLQVNGDHRTPTGDAVFTLRPSAQSRQCATVVDREPGSGVVLRPCLTRDGDPDPRQLLYGSQKWHEGLEMYGGIPGNDCEANMD